MILPAMTKTWLLEAPEPYIRYQTQLLITPETAYASLLDSDSFIQSNIQAISDWKSQVLARHDKADLLVTSASLKLCIFNARL